MVVVRCGGSQRRFCGRAPTKKGLRSLLTGGGWSTNRTSPAVMQIYICPFPQAEPKRQVSIAGGTEPLGGNPMDESSSTATATKSCPSKPKRKAHSLSHNRSSCSSRTPIITGESYLRGERGRRAFRDDRPKRVSTAADRIGSRAELGRRVEAPRSHGQLKKTQKKLDSLCEAKLFRDDSACRRVAYSR